MKHIKWLDSLRGLFAVNVILCHFVCVYYPQMVKTAWGGTPALSVFSDTPLNALINGNIAVQFFFMLSGFLAALSIFTGKDSQSIAFRAFKRYFRLLPMIAGSTILAYILMKASLMFHLEISGNGANDTWLAGFNNFIPTIKNLLYNIFIRPFIFNSEYVGPLWYIKYDFWGYLLSLCICIIVKGYRWRRIAYILILIIIWWNELSSIYSAFILGILLADLYYYTSPQTTYLSKYYTTFINSRCFAIICVIFGSYIAMIPLSESPFYNFLPFIDSGIWHFNELGNCFYRALGVTITVWGIINLKPLQHLLEHKVLLWMGKVSFATYAFHWPIMLSLEAYVFLTFNDWFDYNTSALCAFALTIPVIYIVSYLANKYMDRPINLNKVWQFSNTRRFISRWLRFI